MTDFMTQPILDAVAQLKPIAAQAGCTLTQLALAWVLREPAVTSAIVGATKLSHVDENVAAADLHLDPAIFDEVNRILDPVQTHDPILA